MAFTDIEKKRIEKLLSAFIEKRRPPQHIRPELDLGFSIEGHSVEIFEIRPGWQNPKEKLKFPVARATYIKVRDVWKVYWQRADCKWHGYDPSPKVKKLEEFLKLVDEDSCCCFWG
jgi:hypothetical protein